MSAFEFASSRLACLFLGHRVDPLQTKVGPAFAAEGLLRLRLTCRRCGEESYMLHGQRLSDAMRARWVSDPSKAPL